MASKFIQKIDLRTLRENFTLCIVVIVQFFGVCSLRDESVTITLGKLVGGLCWHLEMLNDCRHYKQKLYELILFSEESQYYID